LLKIEVKLNNDITKISTFKSRLDLAISVILREIQVILKKDHEATLTFN